jgi:hypothetical protein
VEKVEVARETRRVFPGIQNDAAGEVAFLAAEAGKNG